MLAKQGGARTALIEYRVFPAGPGAKWEIRLLARPGAALSLVEEYLDGMPEADRKKCLAALVSMVQNGPSRNPEKNGDLGDGLFEVKEGKHRIVYFYGRERWTIIMTHGFYKNKQKTPPTEIGRALGLRSEWAESH